MQRQREDISMPILSIAIDMKEFVDCFYFICRIDINFYEK